MKRFIKITAAVATLVAAQSVMAQEITQAQKDATAKLVSECVVKHAPANWEMVTTILDRTDPKKAVMYNKALIKDTKQLVDIDVSKCDINIQANDLLKFQALLPADQVNWKSLVLRVNPEGGYEVFTNIAWERMIAKQQATSQEKLK